MTKPDGKLGQERGALEELHDIILLSVFNFELKEEKSRKIFLKNTGVQIAQEIQMPSCLHGSPRKHQCTSTGGRVSPLQNALYSFCMTQVVKEKKNWLKLLPHKLCLADTSPLHVMKGF